jgi:ABC-type xylose transport system substrate-binding protein
MLKLAMGAAALGAMLLTSSAFAQDKGTVGIAMPTKSSARWISDGNNDGRAVLRRPATAPTCSMPKTTFPTSSPRSRT